MISRFRPIYDQSHSRRGHFGLALTISPIRAGPARCSLDRLGFYCILQYINSTSERIFKLSKSKTDTLTFRIRPELKEGLRAAAALEHRSISNMVEILIRDYCERKGIIILELGATLVNKEKELV